MNMNRDEFNELLSCSESSSWFTKDELLKGLSDDIKNPLFILYFIIYFGSLCVSNFIGILISTIMSVFLLFFLICLVVYCIQGLKSESIYNNTSEKYKELLSKNKLFLLKCMIKRKKDIKVEDYELLIKGLNDENYTNIFLSKMKVFLNDFDIINDCINEKIIEIENSVLKQNTTKEKYL